jgi:F-type H+-transporting ATPase subunit gamma
MSSIRNTKNRIKSVQTTAKITKAMKAIAAMRLKRYTIKAQHIENYAITLQNSLNSIFKTLPDALSLPVLVGNPEGKNLVIVIGPSRGFCGGLHRTCVSETIKYFQKQGTDIANPEEADIITVNRPAKRTISKTGGNIVASFDGPYKQIDAYKVLPISELINQLWQSGNYKAVYLSFAKANSALAAKVQVNQFLPFEFDHEADHAEINIDTDYEALIQEILPQLTQAEVHYGLLLTQTAEEGARMLAMNQATDNAKEMEGRLKIVYFRQRQAKITQEIAEIVGGSL